MTRRVYGGAAREVAWASPPPAARRRGGRTSCRAPTMSAAHVTTEVSERRPAFVWQWTMLMALTIARPAEKASHRGKAARRRAAEARSGKVARRFALVTLTFCGTGLWSEVHRQPTKGKRGAMSGKSPHRRDAKKVAKLSMKEKRAAKREKDAPTAFIKPRKAARA